MRTQVLREADDSTMQKRLHTCELDVCFRILDDDADVKEKENTNYDVTNQADIKKNVLDTSFLATYANTFSFIRRELYKTQFRNTIKFLSKIKITTKTCKYASRKSSDNIRRYLSGIDFEVFQKPSKHSIRFTGKTAFHAITNQSVSPSLQLWCIHLQHKRNIYGHCKLRRCG